MKVIQFKDVWEMYRIKFVINKQVKWENFWALKDISFEIERGECVGIIGENGSGKSSILKLIAGLLNSDRGEVNVHGKVSGLLELGVGFHPELTGRENLYANASLFGLKDKEIDSKLEKITEFAGIGRFIDAPVKCYSQGMFVRLAFAIAINMDPEVLVIDDTLAVGDEDFQRKCIRKIFELKDEGKTIVFVTHDMNMLSQLCNRALFLKEGRIVEDGDSKRIISHYMETIGSKKGIGVMKRGPLRAVFNNGRLLLSWNGISLTKGFAGHTRLLASDRYYDSTRADWNIEESSGDRIIVRGAWHGLSLTQRWDLRLEESGAISWQIAMEADKDALPIKHAYVNLMLTEHYDRWLGPEAEGDFPPILPNNLSWEEVFQSPPKSICIGVEGAYLQKDKLPSVILEADNDNAFPLSAKILNTEYFIGARTLQLLCSTSIAVPRKAICFSGTIFFDLPDARSYMAEKVQRFSLGKGPLKLTFKDGIIRLFWDNAEITKERGLYTTLFSLNKWHDSVHADWEVEELTGDRLIVRGAWRSLPISQRWQVYLKQGTAIQWKVDTQVHEKLEIEAENTNLLLSGAYEGWFTSSGYGAGRFPPPFSNDWIDIIQGNISAGFVGVANLEKDQSGLPAVILDIGKGKPNNFVKVLNTDSKLDAKVLQLHKVEPEEKSAFQPGNYPSFRAELRIEEQKEDIIGSHIRSKEIGSNHLRLLFEQDRAHLFWKGVELTKKLCLYTSIRSGGRWYDSTQVDWTIDRSSGKSMLLKGRWRYLPLCQSWEFSFPDKNTVIWKIGMDVFDNLEIDREQANLMLSERYKEWAASGEIKGTFPEFRSDIDDDWDRVWSGGPGDEIGVLKVSGKEKPLPSVVFSAHSQEGVLNIVNSDIFYRSRLLQFVKEGRGRLAPGKYDYFSGRIVVG